MITPSTIIRKPTRKITPQPQSLPSRRSMASSRRWTPNPWTAGEEESAEDIAEEILREQELQEDSSEEVER